MDQFLNGSNDVATGSGTLSDPYYWYGILDDNNPNGCHTKEFNQNSEEGWVRIKLQANTEYYIGQCNLPNGDSWDGYIKMYILQDDGSVYPDSPEATDDDTENWIDEVKTKGTIYYIVPGVDQVYYIKAGSYGDFYPDNPVSLHCYPAPIEE